MLTYLILQLPSTFLRIKYLHSVINVTNDGDFAKEYQSIIINDPFLLIKFTNENGVTAT